MIPCNHQSGSPLREPPSDYFVAVSADLDGSVTG
jgi:hypothetical protein